MDALKALIGHMCVNLSGGDVGMAEQHLHSPKIGTMIQKMGRKRMPKGVW